MNARLMSVIGIWFLVACTSPIVEANDSAAGSRGSFSCRGRAIGSRERIVRSTEVGRG